MQEESLCFWMYITQELCQSKLLESMEKESYFLPAQCMMPCLRVSGVVIVTEVCHKDKEVL
ncbi:unnamed protein product, partial [Arabidopsis lyrata]